MLHEIIRVTKYNEYKKPIQIKCIRDGVDTYPDRCSNLGNLPFDTGHWSLLYFRHRYPDWLSTDDNGGGRWRNISSRLPGYLGNTGIYLFPFRFGRFGLADVDQVQPIISYSIPSGLLRVKCEMHCDELNAACLFPDPAFFMVVN